MSDPELPSIAPEFPETPPPPPERRPFWGYADLFLVIGLALPCLLAGAIVVKGFLMLFRLQLANDVMKLLLAQFLGYFFLFLAMWLWFRQQYGRPFWRSLAWTAPGLGPGTLLLGGGLLAFAVGFASVLLRTPDVSTPMTKLLQDRNSMILVAAFGITLGPLCEELIFRGFMQPLFVRSLGAVAGVCMAAVPFGLLHLAQYGNSWRHGLLITVAGVVFGWMRQKTGSTRASTIMHAAYNATFFLALLAQRKDLPHAW